MTTRAPLPPWRVERRYYRDGRAVFKIYGGPLDMPILICVIHGEALSNAEEIANLIVQRTKP
jgi:hypothetical protein